MLRPWIASTLVTFALVLLLVGPPAAASAARAPETSV